MPIFPKKTSAEKMYNTKKPLNYSGQSGNRKTVQEGYARINTSNMPQFRSGTAPIASGNMAKLGKKAIEIYKTFANTGKQYAKKQPKNMLSFVNQTFKK
jgi:hypothetical protein